MKNNNKTSYTVPIFFALAAVLIAIPLRIYQYFSIIDPETGFYNIIDFSVYVMYIILGLATVVSVAVAYIKHHQMLPTYSTKKSTGFLIVSIIMAIGAIVDTATQLIAYFDLYSADISSSNQTLSEYISSQGGSLLLCQAIFGALAAVYFFVSGIRIGVGNSDVSKLKLLALLPVIWCIFRLLYRFKRTISFINVSDLLVELFMIVFSMVFFLAFAQVSSKVDENSAFWKIYAYGIPASMFALVCFIPRFILVVVGKGDMLSQHYGVHYADITFAIYAIYILISKTKIMAPTPSKKLQEK